jgi:pimeloyl-ACP methyl ester carboxylesterase
MGVDPPPQPISSPRRTTDSDPSAAMNLLRLAANHALDRPANRTRVHPISPRGIGNTLAALVRAVVDTLTLNGVVTVPFTFTLDGFTAQLAAAGAPEHVNATVPVNPFEGVTASEYDAVCPAVTVCDADPPASAATLKSRRGNEFNRIASV